MLKARIVKKIKDNLWIDINDNYVKANIKGVLRKKINPYVGDIVEYEVLDSVPIITNILESKVILPRPKVSNVDIVVIVQSTISPDFDTYVLDQMIVFYEQYNVDIIIALSKTDIVFNERIKQFIDDYNKMGYQCFDLNNENQFKKMLDIFNNKLICLAGNSGVGKTTLINRLIPNLNLKTQETSKALNRGKHTTTNTTIIKANNYYIVDTPGYSTISLNLTKNELAHIFFNRLIGNDYCKFNDCLHTHNAKGCLIKSLINSGNLIQWRYDNYVKIVEGIPRRYDQIRFK